MAEKTGPSSPNEKLTVDGMLLECARLQAPAAISFVPDAGLFLFRVQHPEKKHLMAEGYGATPIEAIHEALTQMDLYTQTRAVEIEWLKRKLDEADRDEGLDTGPS